MTNEPPAMTRPEVTVVMSPRESFSLTQRSIESLYADVSVPFEFVCVDGGSPKPVRDRLRAEAQRRGFRLIRTEHYLTPNEARNIGVRDVGTRYVAFVDNDLIFEPGWLSHMISCAEETGADIVTPVVCIGEPVRTMIHFAGGDARIVEENGRRIFREGHHFINQLLAEAHNELVRRPCELAEFHCMLVRSSTFRRIGPLDQNLTSIFEHTDFCLRVRQQGGTVMFEPKAVVTYVASPAGTFDDAAFFYYRWSDRLAGDSERYFHKQWGTEYNRKVSHFVMWHRGRYGPWPGRRVRAVIGSRASGFLFGPFAALMAWRAERRRARSAMPHNSAR